MEGTGSILDRENRVHLHSRWDRILQILCYLRGYDGIDEITLNTVPVVGEVPNVLLVFDGRRDMKVRLVQWDQGNEVANIVGIKPIANAGRRL